MMSYAVSEALIWSQISESSAFYVMVYSVLVICCCIAKWPHIIILKTILSVRFGESCPGSSYSGREGLKSEPVWATEWTHCQSKQISKSLAQKIFKIYKEDLGYSSVAECLHNKHKVLDSVL